MKAIEILQKRSNEAAGDVKIDLKLYTLAHDLEKRSRSHLKRIITVLSEFDIHDEKHSEKVIENIEYLLGKETLNSLSSYELFLLHLSSYFHDCAMAPSDWEINTMKLTEGNDNYYSVKHSIKYDLKIPLKSSSAVKIIIENKKYLYGSFNSDVSNWMFSPSNENDLIKYLSDLLIDYQNYRNGFADQLEEVKCIDDFNYLNEFIRTDYIRATHHTRIEPYIKNLEHTFSNAFEQPAWGKKLAHDLALVCRSHGEDANFIKSFSTNAQYFGSDSANLQFVAVMLRIGDIIHFSYDRAPIDLRSSKIFKSEYSFQQWAIKNSGANYSIENGKISFRAYCESPETYFKLHQYIDWIELEIQNYFKFQRQWEKNYINNLQDKIDRVNIINDETVFLPKRGLHFSLNQKKILELLMGVGLYKDEFAFLRELYQNSLDACRCMLSLNEALKISSQATIEFSIIKSDTETHLYCIDNGIGMTKEVIEAYLLKIGNSYYKSSDFYKQQAAWGNKFTPTSQFGIGILSCFMIGNKIEITTKVRNSEYVSCSIDGPHENFYYRNTLDVEKEKIPNSGTIIKIRLSDIKNLTPLNNSKISKLGLLLFHMNEYVPVEFSSYIHYLKNWHNHLYNKLNYFIKIIPENIKVLVGIEDGSNIEIISKPLLIDVDNDILDINEADSDFIDYLNDKNRYFYSSQKYSDIKDYVNNYEINIKLENIEYRTNLCLPVKEFDFDLTSTLHKSPIVDRGGICIDGIYVDKSNIIGHQNYYTISLMRNGIINFFGEIRPQLSVDRTSILDYKIEFEDEAKEVTLILIMQIIDIVREHIKTYNLDATHNELDLLWEYVFEIIGFADSLFINKLVMTDYGNIKLKNLNLMLEVDLSMRDFLTELNLKIVNFNLSSLDTLSKKLLISKMTSAQEIKINENSISIITENYSSVELIKEKYYDSEFSTLICADEWHIDNAYYDIVSNLYPLIPKRLFDLIDRVEMRRIGDRIKIVHSFSNGLTAFFKQSPLLIKKELGLYISNKDSFGNTSDTIYDFQQKRSKIRLLEINSVFTDTKSQERYVLVVYIAPVSLSDSELTTLKKLEAKDPLYVKGVNEGWSLLVTNMDIDNVLISPGKCSRENLVSLISDEFWELYKDYTFRFTDNVIMKK